jgi:hypothetical protein
MSLRSVTDSEGVAWRVWDVLPQTRYIAGLEHGWLCFESVTEKRRLTPIPPGWQERGDDELLALLREADVVRPARQLSSEDAGM